jgi:hypothetical protein
MRLMTLLSACLLAGCAPLLEDLQNINANLKAVNSSLGTSTPSVHTVTATAENVCNRAAFEEAFKRDYTRHWNSVIRDKESYYRLMLKQSPQDAAARHNYALYRGKRVEGLGYGSPDYGVNSDNPCVVQSTLQGMSAGMQAAGLDLKALEEQEI